MTDKILIDVRGTPVPQGSMRAFKAAHGDHVALKYPPAVYAWRSQVCQAVIEARVAHNLPVLLGPVSVGFGFDLARPLGHFGTGRNLLTVKPSAPPEPTTAPDLDKLVRCICDAITDAGLWRDDAQITSIIARKRFTVEGETPGVRISIDPRERTP